MTLLYHSKTSGNVMLPAVEDISVGLENISITNRVIITFILQCALGYTSGVFVGLSAKLRDSLMLILFCMIGAISVWLSFFNLEYVLIIGPVTGFWGFLLFGVALFIVLAIEQVTFYEYADDGDHKNFDLGCQ